MGKRRAKRTFSDWLFGVSDVMLAVFLCMLILFRFLAGLLGRGPEASAFAFLIPLSMIGGLVCIVIAAIGASRKSRHTERYRREKDRRRRLHG